LVKRTVSIHPFIDLIIKEVWQAGIHLGWPRASYSLGLEAAIIASYYEMVPARRLPHREAVDSALKFLNRKVKITEKDERMLRDYVQCFTASRNKEIAAPETLNPKSRR
jgi:hypothetical protein